MKYAHVLVSTFFAPVSLPSYMPFSYNTAAFRPARPKRMKLAVALSLAILAAASVAASVSNSGLRAPAKQERRKMIATKCSAQCAGVALVAGSDKCYGKLQLRLFN